MLQVFSFEFFHCDTSMNAKVQENIDSPIIFCHNAKATIKKFKRFLRKYKRLKVKNERKIKIS